MSRYIDADKELQELENMNLSELGEQEKFGVRYAKVILSNAPTADVKPIMHAHWTDGGYACGETCWTCSMCGHEEWRSGKTRFCPNCGAKMDEEVE